MASNSIKKWFTSKTLWINVIAIIAIILQMEMGFVLEAAEEAIILGFINIIVRFLTKKGLE